MFKKSYFPEWEQSSTNDVYGCSVNFTTSLEKAHVVASSSAPLTNNIQDSDEYQT
jgi:hypothetical protein